jgi:2-polyprenyl-3-methyl-5-hydroxy-6-metoxy-1,4-benzoquinol methylase
MNKNEIRRYLNVIRRALSLLEAEFENDGSMDELIGETSSISHKLENVVAPKSVEQSVEIAPVEVKPAKNEDRQKHVKSLLAIDCWPEAVPEALVIQPTDKDQKHRASSVMDMVLDRSIEGMSFLDYGCGEGWITQEAKKRGAKESIGYDLIKNKKWEDCSGPSFINTTSVLQQNQFDIIFLYDVLDHCVDTELVMNNVSKLIKKTGTVYVRCHPWTSRHATHLFKQGINKAYMHMFLSWDEIEELIGQKPMFTRTEKDPIEAYTWWFRNFKIVKQRIIKEPVSDFFKHPDFKNLLANEQNILNIDDFLVKMEIQFVDFKLELK